jgi:DNA-binding transcriptional LysR family regulator
MTRNIETVDLRLLRCFDVLMAERSVSRAAQRMNLSQPAMSIALRRLRTLFGDPLLLRTHGDMVPTSRALALTERVRRVLEELTALTAGSSPFDPQTSRAQFTLTAPGYIAYVLLPRLAKHLERHAPNVHVDVRASNRERATEWLEKGEIDFRIGWIREPPAEHRFKTLYSDHFVCLARKNHPAIRGRLTTEQFCALPHVRSMVHQRSDSGEVIDQAVEALGRRLSIPMLVQDIFAVPYIVASSRLIAAVPARFAKTFAANLPVRAHRLPLNIPEQSIALYWHERTHRDAAHAWFRDLLGAVSRAL